MTFTKSLEKLKLVLRRDKIKKNIVNLFFLFHFTLKIPNYILYYYMLLYDTILQIIPFVKRRPFAKKQRATVANFGYDISL